MFYMKTKYRLLKQDIQNRNLIMAWDSEIIMHPNSRN